jgi:hypothetical protein
MRKISNALSRWRERAGERVRNFRYIDTLTPTLPLKGGGRKSLT